MEKATQLPDQSNQDPPAVDDLRRLLSAEASGKFGNQLTDAEIQTAEEDAEAWARKTNSC